MFFKSYLELSTCLSGNSTYTQHLINHGHFVGHIEDIMDVIFTAHKGKHVGKVQQYHMYQKTKTKKYRLMMEIPLLKKSDVIVKHDPL
jgi:sporulation protein YlmC with PRC-barrel domain